MERIVTILLIGMMMICGFYPRTFKGEENVQIENLEENIKNVLSAELLNGYDMTDSLDVMVFVSDVDHGKVMQAFREAYPEEYAIYSAVQENDTHPGMVYADLDAKDLGSKVNEGDEKDNDLIQSAIERKREIYRDFYHKNNIEIADKYVKAENVLFISEYSPMMILRIDYKSVLELASDPKTEWISLFIEIKSTEEGLATANQLSRADIVQ